ncbi:signal peptidase II [Erysipelothrix aquatica]|uniref:signal peptidase II n=1 Tax=Erysipelothrix aquatica TaxID=2683714 RepID=UPI001359A100|nr:signal peptidase II [Erysipelothrix aquatica]
MKKLLLVLSVGILALDLFVKYWIESTLRLGQSITIIPNFFELTYVRNYGAAWSLLSGKQFVFLFVTPIIIGALVYYYVKKSEPLHLTAIAFILAGAVGNFVDRVVFGYVRDMFSFNIFGYAFPVFNVADMAVVFGVFLVILIILREEMRLKHEQNND